MGDWVGSKRITECRDIPHVVTPIVCMPFQKREESVTVPFFYDSELLEDIPMLWPIWLLLQYSQHHKMQIIMYEVMKKDLWHFTSI